MTDVEGLAHIGIAVRDLAAAERAYLALGAQTLGREEVASEGVRVSFLSLGGVRIELLEPIDPDAEAGVARFLRERGGGVHHLAFDARDLTATLGTLGAAGIAPVGGGARSGAEGRTVAFLHPRDTGGVLLELCEVKR
ncbi:MAG: VOC family protein [Thermaerobacter sp.]|nr:VOC family protein [Thermaerobacter sp.]